MASRTLSGHLFSVGLAGRAAGVGVLAFGATELVLAAHYYASASIVLGFAGLLSVDLGRRVLRADRSMARFFHGIKSGEFDRAGRSATGYPQFAEALDAAATMLERERAASQAQIDYLQGLVDSVPAALIAIDPAGVAKAANRAAERLLLEDVARLPDSQVIGDVAAVQITALRAGAREIIRLADGREVLGSAIELKVAGSAPRRLISLQDVEAELDAVEIKAWRDLVRVLAHEMLNSLTAICSLAESVPKRLGNPSEVAAAVEVIARRSQGLMNFVERYREVAEIPVPIEEPMSLASFAADLQLLMQPTFDAAGAEFTTTVRPQTLMIRADASLLEQAIINLLKNAAEAVAGRVSPSVTLTCLDLGDYVEITVSDNGAGISPEIRAKLFVPFFTTKTGGFGIGLSVARQIVLGHHGQFEVSSGPDGGAVFKLRLPKD